MLHLLSGWVMGLGKEAQTWSWQEFHMSVTQGQPTAESFLTLSDFILNHVDSKEIPKKQALTPKLIQISVIYNKGPLRGHAKALSLHSCSRFPEDPVCSSPPTPQSTDMLLPISHKNNPLTPSKTEEFAYHHS